MSNNKKIFLAGASGVIGRTLSKLLVDDGWTVYGTTRSKDKTDMLKALGVEPIILDVYDVKAFENGIYNIANEDNRLCTTKAINELKWSSDFRVPK